MPDVVVPPMGESIKEGTIAAVLKQVGAAVREDEVIAQIETDKVTIDVKAPAAGFLHKVLVKPSDLVTAGQLVAVVGAEAVAGGAASAAATPAAPAAAAAAAPASTSGRAPAIKFPPRVTAAGVRISSLSDGEYEKALAAASTASTPAAAAAPAAATPAAAAPTMAEAKPAVAPHPMSAMKAATMGAAKNKNRLTYVTRPDGRGGPPRRELTARELELINLGGAQ
ncbi:hypothetical protein CHLRE_03g185600v5 [Chlamydomonas reinhardtii]|uniref:Lipoyl-binding domain-containing protein n=1 Tax=Chlamydomonas reinhardtii TaxID=3055 RepID=A0A2K3DY19_CHLRE|nr:uncharacterized protein CHLRE_03g185600v5 [Chlamydomonas reinhardtii]PNW85420.1 hypothetical protein CHLRE_03g185600v5 [Chlamydomonas reinhardtii]